MTHGRRTWKADGFGIEIGSGLVHRSGGVLPFPSYGSQARSGWLLCLLALLTLLWVSSPAAATQHGGIAGSGAALCGNGIVETGEECDDGNGNRCDGCGPDCRIESNVCGDGVVDPLCEVCDDGNRVNEDACRNDCRLNFCGDGVLNPAAEQCDDKNRDDSDGCTNGCTTCGDGIITLPEECDDGNRSNDDACRNDCRPNVCGDGHRNPTLEACDDGNTHNGDGCDSNCTPSSCGNGIQTAGEQCDDGNQIEGDGCDSNCTPTACGNGVVSGGEQCDDGNTSACDGCSPTCENEPVGYHCGDGVVSSACGEECDDGYLSNEDACRNDCRFNACGDGFHNPATEQCDDGNANPFDGCSRHCIRCGNGIQTAPEECDDGNTDPADGCTTACTICGDGTVTVPEQCDDGNLIDGDDCSASCAVPGCGNAIPEGDEECDDGGVCVGGADEGAYCSGPEQCTSGECRTVGGNGCAANCTNEDERLWVLASNRKGKGGDNDGRPCDPWIGSADCPDGQCFFAGLRVQTGLFVVEVPAASASLTLRLGNPRESGGSDEIPVAVRAEDVRFEPIRVEGHLCLCIRGVEKAGLAEGISGSGAISCAGPLAGVDVMSSIDHYTNDIDPNCENGFLEDGSEEHPHQGTCNGPEEISFSGTGPAGSARLDLRLESWSIADGGTCVQQGSGDPSRPQGADGIPCTDDDPRYRYRSCWMALCSLLPPEFELRLTTGHASAEILDAADISGLRIGAGSYCGTADCMTEATGAVFDCPALLAGDISGATLVAAFGVLDAPVINDNVATFMFTGPLSEPTAADTATPTTTPTPTPSATSTVTASLSPTPTATPTPVPSSTATATRTSTSTPIPTATPIPTTTATRSATAAPTPTATPEPDDDGGGCAVRPGNDGAAWWLLVPVLLPWTWHRSRPTRR